VVAEFVYHEIPVINQNVSRSELHEVNPNGREQGRMDRIGDMPFMKESINLASGATAQFTLPHRVMAI
jgi:hypothetical protein